MFSPFKDNNKTDSNELYPLHKAVFHNDLRKMEALFKSGCDINQQDVHGNTPLHIAAILGHKDAINKLLERKAVTRLKNNGGWSSLLEAVSYGDRQISCAIRMDTTLVSFNERSWDRGDVSLLYNPILECTGKHLVIMDNKKQVYQRIRHEISPNELNEQVDIMMSNDIVALQISTKPITFVRSMAGWFFKHEKSEEVGGFSSDYYMVDGLTVVTRKRREHLTAEDVKKNKAFIQEFATGTFRSNGSTHTMNTVTTGVSDDVDDMKNRKSLCPPPKATVSWQEYITSTQKPPPVGRPHVEKTNSKEFKAVVAMSQDFPLPVTVLLDILEIVSPFKHIGKLKEFCNAKLPPGFPVKLEIPLLPTISAKVTFQKFEWRDDLTSKFFSIPRSYGEDSKRFPDL